MQSLAPLLPLCLLAVAAAQDRTRNPALQVAFVGDLQQDRGKAFVQFLRSQYPRVDAIERAGCTPSRLRAADVVVLDWPQPGAVSDWIRDKQGPRSNPLGELRRWDRPTVLLGSAGLNLAADWNLPGAYG